ncbi:hypothetical protein AX768_02305 [Burkholderia sp. PAMC 28687]|uniref:hypothetical protein n=1 Tax=Burkholderia sp. PAMC 28687 TaxID=1795874 RepID=UPI0007823285|nr:hypothetical protein [Burkholderia sp. PAMC 28687]AMM13121.1 hypothetical protein AX768_02305 [Burkholderia sp. PAMC 28687]
MTIRVLKLCVATLTIVGMLIGYFSGEVIKRIVPAQTFVMIGSSSVFNFIRQNYRDRGNDPVWIDVPSGEALSSIFSVFDYGHSVGNADQPAFVALSSFGTIKLRSVFQQATTSPELRNDNFWLSITLARRPILLLYRNIEENDLGIKSAGSFPPEGASQSKISLKYIQYSSLRKLIELPVEQFAFKRYLPEETSGTRAAVDAATDRKIHWPGGAQVPDFVSDVGERTAFIALQPEVNFRGEKTTCELLKKHNVKVAIICQDRDDCSKVVTAQYVAVLKVAKDSSHGVNGFEISNLRECNFARAFSKRDLPGCRVLGDVNEGDHILSLDDVGDGAGLQEYLGC